MEDDKNQTDTKQQGGQQQGQKPAQPAGDKTKSGQLGEGQGGKSS